MHRLISIAILNLVGLEKQGSRYRSQISQIAKENKMWRKKYAFGDTKWRLKNLWRKIHFRAETPPPAISL